MEIVQTGPFVKDESKDILPPKKRPHYWCREDSEMKIEDYALYRILRPVLLTMGVFGFCSLAGNGSNGRRFYMCYSVFALLTMYIHLGFYLAHIRNLSGMDEIVTKGSDLLWNMHVTFLGTLMFLIIVRGDKMHQLLTLYEKTKEGIWKFEEDTSLKRRISVYVLLGWLMITINILFIVYLEVKLNDALVSLCIALPRAAYSSASWTIPFILIMSLTDILATNFRFFNSKLTDISRSGSLEIFQSITMIRDMHVAMQRMVAASESILNKIAAVSIISNLTLICCMIYAIVYNIHYIDGDPIATLGSTFWLCTYCVMLFGSMQKCASLNEEVNANLQQGELRFTQMIK